LQRVGEPHDHRESWQREAPFHIADERVIRFNHRGELLLRKVLRKAKFAEMPSKDYAIALSLCHV